MAIIIDFAHMREVLEARPGRTRTAYDGPPAGEVVLFTGVRYERYETDFAEEPKAEAAGGRHGIRKKKN